jgi:Family of unknown function (DUF5317)
VILPVIGLIALALPALFGGRLSRLASLRLHGSRGVMIALLIQIVVLELLPGPRRLLEAAHLGSYLLAAWFVYLNRRVPGILVLAAGAVTNGVTIALNGGTLPADPDALRRAGIVEDGGFTNSGPVADPVLPWLGDVLAIPREFPLANVFSVGDILIVLGVLYASFRICGTRWTQCWEPATAGHGYGRRIYGIPTLVPAASGAEPALSATPASAAITALPAPPAARHVRNRPGRVATAWRMARRPRRDPARPRPAHRLDVDSRGGAQAA